MIRNFLTIMVAPGFLYGGEAEQKTQEILHQLHAPKVCAPQVRDCSSFSTAMNELTGLFSRHKPGWLNTPSRQSMDHVFARKDLPSQSELDEALSRLQKSLEELEGRKLTAAEMRSLKQASYTLSVIYGRALFHNGFIDKYVAVDSKSPQFKPNLEIHLTKINLQQLEKLAELRSRVKALTPFQDQSFSVIIADTSTDPKAKKSSTSASSKQFLESGLAMANKRKALFFHTQDHRVLRNDLIWLSATGNIQRMAILGHGGEGVQYINSEPLSSAFFSELRRDLKSPWEVDLLGCSTASGSVGENYIREIGKSIGGDGQVTGFRYEGSFYRFGNLYFNLDSGPSPSWHGLPNVAGVETVFRASVKK